MSPERSNTLHVKNIAAFILLSIAIALFILSVSIAVPVLTRQIFYMQVDRLRLSETTGFSREQIIEAYNDVLNYCTMAGEDSGQSFRTGTLAWSEEGKDHFDDVARLFRLDFIIAVITGSLLGAYLLVRVISRTRKIPAPRPCRILRRGPLFWGPSVLLAVFAALTIAAVSDFDGFFTWFHHLFFPGKENWLLNPDTDEIILILPYEVLQTFAVIIAALILTGCVICIITDFLRSRSEARRSEAH